MTRVFVAVKEGGHTVLFTYVGEDMPEVIEYPAEDVPPFCATQWEWWDRGVNAEIVAAALLAIVLECPHVSEDLVQYVARGLIDRVDREGFELTSDDIKDQIALYQFVT